MFSRSLDPRRIEAVIYCISDLECYAYPERGSVTERKRGGIERHAETHHESNRITPCLRYIYYCFVPSFFGLAQAWKTRTRGEFGRSAHRGCSWNRATWKKDSYVYTCSKLVCGRRRTVLAGVFKMGSSSWGISILNFIFFS